MSFERRRWAHTFPLRSDGTPIFQHWTSVQAQSENIADNISNAISSSYKSNGDNEIKNISPDSSKYISQNTQNRNLSRINEQTSIGVNSKNKSLVNDKALDLKSNKYWETLHKSETKAFMRPGVAWKSLTTPACLPLTTDFFPNKETWDRKFMRSGDYILSNIEEIRNTYIQNHNYQINNKISMEQVFYDLVGHRLAMGFQMVVPKDAFTKKESNSSNHASEQSMNTSSNMLGNMSSMNLGLALSNSNFICDVMASSSVKQNMIAVKSIKGYYKLSLGRIYHELFYIVDKSNNSEYIKVEINMPEKRFLTEKEKENYWYRFQVPDSKTYDISYIKMTRKLNENIKWNLIDTYICIQGNGSLTPSELEKCWRQRIYLIPILYTTTKQNSAGTKQQLCHTNSAGTSNNQSNSLTSSADKIGEIIRNNSIPSSSIDDNNNKGSSSSDSIFTYNYQTAGIIPASMLEDQNVPVYCDIYQRKSPEELKFYRDYYFIKFMEGLNKLNRGDDRRYYSKATLAYSESLNNKDSQNDQGIAVSVIMSQLLSNTTNLNSSQPINLNSSQKLANTLNIPKNIQSTCHNPKNLVSPRTKLYTLLVKYSSINLEVAPDGNEKADSILKNEIKEYLMAEYINYMIGPDGIPFFENKNDIPMNCFVSAESIWWCIEHIPDIDIESEAIVFMQILCDFDLVRHISNITGMNVNYDYNNDDMPKRLQQKIFVHGFTLYYIITDQNRQHHLFTKDYCEVGFCDLDIQRNQKSCEHQNSKSLVSVYNLLPENKTSLPITATEYYKAYSNLLKSHSKSQFAHTSPDSILKLVNVDVDSSHKSNRVEWASAVYRSHYHQLCAFELEIQWEMATGQLLAELMSIWSKHATRYNYHIVAAPIDPFAMPIVQNSDPLRGPIIVKLNFQCLIQNEKILFENYIDRVYKLNYESFSSQGEFKLESGMLSGNSSSSMSYIIDQLSENNPEFMDFLMKKHSEKQKSSNNRDFRGSEIDKEHIVRHMIQQKIQDEPEFIEHEFQEFIERLRIFRLQYFQEAILEKFGFVRNGAIVKTPYSDEDPTFFIHSSGGMFVMLPNYYANYYTNRSRHTSSNSTHSVTTTSSSVLNQNRINRSYQNKDEDFNKTANFASITSPISNFNSQSVESSSFNVSQVSRGSTQIPIIANSISSTIGNGLIRERSNTKSQHAQFIKLNEKNYLDRSNSQQDCDVPGVVTYDMEDVRDGLNYNPPLEYTVKNEEDTVKTEENIKNDLLFRPKTTDLKFSTKSNEKLDLIQQQQREQMLLQSTTPTQISHLEQHMSNSVTSSDSLFMLNNQSSIHSKKIPFYAEADTYIGFSWSWNFMLGKKWRSQYTGDEAFQDNMLADFKLFCSNKDGRLIKFYNESKNFLN